MAALVAAIGIFTGLNRRLAVAQRAARKELAQRKRHEEELRLAKEHAEETADRLRKLSQAIEQSPASVVITDPQGSIEYVSPGFVKTTGYTCEESLGKNPRILQSGVHPPEFYEQMWKTLAQRGMARPNLQSEEERRTILGRRHHCSRP